MKMPEKISKMSEQELYEIKRSFLRLTNNDVNMVKNIITSYGMKYIIADGEADPICSKLVNNNIVYACMTQDMDQMVYRTKRVFRDFDINKHTVIVYNYSNIIRKLKMNTFDFTVMCILSGCDYINKNKENYLSNTKNIRNKPSNIFYYYKLYSKYLKYKIMVKNTENFEYRKRLKSFKNFMSWLIHKKYVDFGYHSDEYNKICTIIDIYKNDIKVDIKSDDIVFGEIKIFNLYKIIFNDNIWKDTQLLE